MKTNPNANRAEVKRFQLDKTILDAAMNSHDDETRPTARRIVAAAGVRGDL
jgi:hypothetical protein